MTNQTITVPLFPLPDTVFFPHTLLPLHVFEPRYKAMIADVLESERLIGVVQLRPGWDADYFGTPPIYKIFGVGRIIDSDQWPDGRYDILLSGLYRAHLVQEISHETYREAEVELINDIIPAEQSRDVYDVHQILLEVLKKLSNAMPSDIKIHPGENLDNLSPGMLTDVMANLLVNDPYDRQSLLSDPNVARRQQLLRVQIQNLLNPSHEED